MKNAVCGAPYYMALSAANLVSGGIAAFSVLAVVCVVLISVWAVLVVRANIGRGEQPTEVYEMGDVVEYGDNYYVSDRNKSYGYTIQVTGATLIKYEDYIEKYDLTYTPNAYSSKPEYIYEVYARFSYPLAEEYENNGIDMFHTTLCSDNVSLMYATGLWDAHYPQIAGTYTFKLRPETEMDFSIPFVTDNADIEKYCDYDYMMSHPFYLRVSQYPVRKMIKVTPTVD